ncbi:MAG: glycerophosphodiester phosphodiesterase [Flavisolibacter sp.]|nr:glycerophosphodiester phosphodiesterase [Flavisolibacter sp.]
MQQFDTEGHRGCRGLMPENTIPAMLKAIDLGVTTLEMDAAITKDDQVILSHDPFMSHWITTKPDGNFIKPDEEKQHKIYQMTYAEVQQYDVGSKPHPQFPQQQKMKVTKPLLQDVIDSAEAYARKRGRTIYYNIETKSTPAGDNINHPPPDQFVTLLMQVISKKGITPRVIIQSFDPRTLQYLHQHYPKVQTSLLIEGFDKRPLQEQLTQLGFTPTIYSPEYSLVTEELVETCHRKGIKVIPWTVNKVEEMIRLKGMGVDGLISDYPNLYAQMDNTAKH